MRSFAWLVGAVALLSGPTATPATNRQTVDRSQVPIPIDLPDMPRVTRASFSDSGDGARANLHGYELTGQSADGIYCTTDPERTPQGYVDFHVMRRLLANIRFD